MAVNVTVTRRSANRRHQQQDYVIITLDAKNFYNSIDKAACRNAGQTLQFSGRFKAGAPKAH